MTMTPETTLQSSTLLSRLAEVMHETNLRLQKAQSAVSEIVQTDAVTQDQLEQLQSLDMATQEVEALETLLGAASAQLASGGNDSVCQFEQLFKNVTLSHVIEHIKGVDASKPSSFDDDIILF